MSDVIQPDFDEIRFDRSRSEDEGHRDETEIETLEKGRDLAGLVSLEGDGKEADRNQIPWVQFHQKMFHQARTFLKYKTIYF